MEYILKISKQFFICKNYYSKKTTLTEFFVNLFDKYFNQHSLFIFITIKIIICLNCKINYKFVTE